MVDVDGIAANFRRLTAQVDCLDLRVGGHPALSIYQIKLAISQVFLTPKISAKFERGGGANRGGVSHNRRLSTNNSLYLDNGATDAQFLKSRKEVVCMLSNDDIADDLG